MFLVFKEILLRLAGSWELLCGAQKRGDGMIGEKKAVEGDGTFWGPRAFEEYGLNPGAEGFLSSKQREGLHSPHLMPYLSVSRMVTSMSPETTSKDDGHETSAPVEATSVWASNHSCWR